MAAVMSIAGDFGCSMLRAPLDSSPWSSANTTPSVSLGRCLAIAPKPAGHPSIFARQDLGCIMLSSPFDTAPWSSANTTFSVSLGRCLAISPKPIGLSTNHSNWGAKANE